MIDAALFTIAVVGALLVGLIFGAATIKNTAFRDCANWGQWTYGDRALVCSVMASPTDGAPVDPAKVRHK